MVETSSLPPSAQRLWAAFLDQADDPADAERRLYGVFSVGDSEVDADEGARLILSGAKTATSSLQWEYEATGNCPPSVGTFSILMDGKGDAVGIVETIWLKVQPLGQIDEQFARDYGEWDRTLATWRKECLAYYAHQCEALGRTPSPDMPLLCERFRVVFPENGDL